MVRSAGYNYEKLLCLLFSRKLLLFEFSSLVGPPPVDIRICSFWIRKRLDNCSRLFAHRRECLLGCKVLQCCNNINVQVSSKSNNFHDACAVLIWILPSCTASYSNTSSKPRFGFIFLLGMTGKAWSTVTNDFIA